MYYLIILFLAITTIFANDSEDLVVQLPKGKIRGHILKSYSGTPYYAFQNIPYAAPPVGNKRFQLPTEPEPWDGILNTTKNTAVCYQSSNSYPTLQISEDCLYLNVYSQVKPGSSRLVPVYFWIHGGAYRAGSGAFEYFGPQFIMDDAEVVIVTINYRVGVFGFLTTEDDVIPGNLAFQDQRLAMKWVHDNIGLFGGNKSAVTIGGESAGAGAVGFHILGKSEKSAELFQAAILQSGHSLWTSFVNKGKQAALELGKILAGNFSSQNSSDLLVVLQKASASDILKANVSTDWGPILEKKGYFSYPMLQSFMDGNTKHVPLLIGFNSEEWIYQAMDSNIKAKARLLDDDPSLLVNNRINMSKENRTLAGKLLTKIYTNSSFEKDIGAYIRFASDKDFATPIMKIAELECAHTDVYVYRFAYKGKLGGQLLIPVIPGADRVGHAEDLHYMWNDGSNNDLDAFPTEDQRMFRRYSKLWLNFIKYHNPTPFKDAMLQEIIWPKLENTKEIQMNFLNLNESLDIQQNPRNYKQNKEVLDKYMLPPYIYY